MQSFVKFTKEIIGQKSNKARFLFLLSILLCFDFSTVSVFAQEKPKVDEAQNLIIAQSKMMNGVMKMWLLSSAENMPAENYNFKPTDSVRTYGQLIGHIADANYLFCSVVSGVKAPDLKIEQTKTSKGELIASLKESFAYCDKIYNEINETTANQVVKFQGRQFTKIGMTTINLAHNSLHYGNLIVYLRMKNIVPPSSDPSFVPPPPNK